MVLVDFKGGATFAGMARLAHVAAVITNLQDDAGAGRPHARGALRRAEPAPGAAARRRQPRLRPRLRAGPPARRRRSPPLPNLLVVVDEFSELIAQQSEFVELFVQIGRLGRSLGLHLLLASQRLEEGKIRGLEAHLSYRIALRTFSAAESRAVLGVPDAYELPRRRGTAPARPTPSVLTRFRTAYVSGAYRAGGAGARRAAAGPTGACRSRPPTSRRGTRPRRPAPRDAAEDDPTRPTRADVMVADRGQRRRRAPGVAAAADRPPALDALLPRLADRPGRGLGRPLDAARALQVADRHVDLPFQQRRDVSWVDLVRGGGHVGRGRRAAVRQVDRAAHADRRSRAAPHPGRGAVLLPGLRRRRAARDGRTCRTSAVSPGARTPTRCAGWSPRWPRCSRTGSGGSAELGVDSMATYRRRARDGRRLARRPVRRRLPGGRRLGVLRSEFEELEAKIIARPPASWPTACTSCWPPTGGWTCGWACGTSSAPRRSCGSATRSTPRSTASWRPTCPTGPVAASARAGLHHLGGVPGSTAGRAPTAWPTAWPAWSPGSRTPGTGRPRRAVRLLPGRWTRRLRPAGAAPRARELCSGWRATGWARWRWTSTPSRGCC